MTTTNEKGQMVPTGARKVQHKTLDATVYVYERGMTPLFIGYAGKSTKPKCHFRYTSEASRQAGVMRFFRDMEARAATKALQAKVKAETKARPTTLKEGDILSGSWGFEQTNREFAMVTKKITEHTVECVMLGMDKDYEGYNGMAGKATPNVNSKGKPFRARVKKTPYGDRIAVNSHCDVSLWGGKPEYFSEYA